MDRQNGTSQMDNLFLPCRRPNLQTSWIKVVGIYYYRSRKCTKSQISTPTLPPLANQLTSMCFRHSKFFVENCIPLKLSDTDDNPLHYNPTAGPFISLRDASNSLVASRQILIDKFKLPLDNCNRIASAITNRSAITGCDGFFYPHDWLGTVAFVIVTDKKDKKTLTATNSSPYSLADQFPYKNKLIGVDSIHSALVILVQYFDIKKGTITIALDYEYSLKICPNDKPLNIKTTFFDILQNIQNRLDILLINVTQRWMGERQL